VIKHVQNVQIKMEGESEPNQKVEMIETAIDEEEEEEKEEEAADASAHPEGSRTRSLNTKKGIFFSTILSLLNLPPLRFHCVGGCWDRTIEEGRAASRSPH
jgi:hypothetical protein